MHQVSPQVSLHRPQSLNRKYHPKSQSQKAMHSPTNDHHAEIGYALVICETNQAANVYPRVCEEFHLAVPKTWPLRNPEPKGKVFQHSGMRGISLYKGPGYRRCPTPWVGQETSHNQCIVTLNTASSNVPATRSAGKARQKSDSLQTTFIYCLNQTVLPSQDMAEPMSNAIFYHQSHAIKEIFLLDNTYWAYLGKAFRYALKLMFGDADKKVNFLKGTRCSHL